MKVIWTCILLVALLLPHSIHADEQRFLVLTENYPPYNYQEHGQVIGISTDLLMRIFEMCNNPTQRKDIQLLPWKRAYQDFFRESNTLIYSTVRTEEREALFKWVGPIAHTRIGLVARADTEIKINSIQDIHKYRIGVVAEDVSESILKGIGIPSEIMEYANTPWSNMRKLQHGRIDMFAYDIDAAISIGKALGFKNNSFKLVHLLGQHKLYYAFHKNTPDQQIQKFQRALDTLKLRDGSGESEHSRIFDKYFNEMVHSE
ncbi:MAG: substrate-binding periplasmic protein [Desulfovibrio sp.]